MCVVGARVQFGRGMLIYVKTLTGRKSEFDFDGSATTHDVKVALQEKEGIDVKQIRLIFKGKQLKDTSSLDSIGVKGGDTLHMVLALRGGGDV